MTEKRDFRIRRMAADMIKRRGACQGEEKTETGALIDAVREFDHAFLDLCGKYGPRIANGALLAVWTERLGEVQGAHVDHLISAFFDLAKRQGPTPVEGGDGTAA